MNTPGEGEGRLGVVVIGRDEGPRLREALGAAVRRGDPCVYVDSGSRDGSLELARACPGVVAEALDPARPFTAARGRHRGFTLLAEAHPDLAWVQFVDGDCVLSDGWLEAGVDYLRRHPDVGVVAGRLREHDPQRNAYHRLADMEWNHPPGEAETTGGLALMRVEAYRAGGGFDPGLAAGEELDLARRIRAAGYRIVRLPEPMAEHDIAMDRFGEWWERTVRTGVSRAEGAWRVRTEEPERLREVASICFWGAGLPAAAAGLALPTLGLSLGLFAGYPLLWRRVRRWRLERGDSPRDAALYATAAVAGKLPNAIGVARFARRVLRGGVSRGPGR